MQNWRMRQAAICFTLFVLTPLSISGCGSSDRLAQPSDSGPYTPVPHALRDPQQGDLALVGGVLKTRKIGEQFRRRVQ
jgi:hypothetical protein